MIRRILTHTLVATLLIAAAAFSYQAFVRGNGLAGATASLSDAVFDGD
ncbi:hypothetical protein GGE65_006335 [Skermanella aerolata]